MVLGLCSLLDFGFGGVLLDCLIACFVCDGFCFV